MIPILPSKTAPRTARRLPLLAGVCLAGLVHGPAIAQDAAPQPSEADASQRQQEDGAETESGTAANGDILVEGRRLRGQLDVETAPILQLNEDDIAAEGVTSLSDLVTQITNQTGSARGRGGGGRPVILINGIRIGSFREFANYPPEALARVEVFPEEVAQRFGFPPDRRVINLILKENYRNAEVEFEFEGPSRGGNYTREQELGFLQIADGGRINVNLRANDTSLLTEDERDIIQTPGSVSDLASDPDQAPFRSLVSDSRNLNANISWAKAIIDSGTSLSANFTYNRSDFRTLQGLNSVLLTDANGDSLFRTFGEETPLEQRISTDSFSASGSLTRALGIWRLTSTFDANISESTQNFDRRFDVSELQADALAGNLALDGALPSAVGAGFDTALTSNASAQTLTTIRGPLLELPAGDLLATFDAGYNWTNIESSDTRNAQLTQLTRGVFSTGANFVVPITSRQTGFADALGSFTLNAQVGLDSISDFGTLGDYTVGLRWAPTDKLDLSANYIVREVAPSLSQLGNPQVTFFNTPVFDFVNGETVLANVIVGGNPDLLAETQRDWKFALNWQLPFWEGTRFTVEYINNRSDDVTRGFPQITPEIEAAFPDRIIRDANGVLTTLDRRQVTFAETRAKRLQFGLFTRGSIGGGQRGGPPGGARGRGGRPGGAGGPPPGAQGRAGPPQGAEGPPGGDRRAQFMAMRERLCADDGLELINKIATAIENGEDLSAIMPGMNTQRIERFLSRARGEDGTIDRDRLAQMRERICSMDPAMFGGRSGPRGQRPAGPPATPPATSPATPPADQAQTGENAATPPNGAPGGAPSSAGRPTASAAFRAKACGPDGLAAMRALIGKIERGEDVSEELPGVDPAFIKIGLDQARDENGKIPDTAIERFRTMFCGSGQQASGQQGGQQGGQRAGGRPGGGGPAFNPLSRGNFRGFRYFASLNHTIELENEITIAPGLPVIDQLDGDATGAFGFPRHSTRLEAGIFGSGIGMRLSGRYTGETRLNGSGLPGGSDLFFDDLVTFDLRVFSEIGQLVGKNDGWLKNFRISLRADNVFDARRRVTDEFGDTPINYQPFLIDPVGRFIGIDLRKLF